MGLYRASTLLTPFVLLPLAGFWGGCVASSSDDDASLDGGIDADADHELDIETDADLEAELDSRADSDDERAGVCGNGIVEAGEECDTETVPCTTSCDTLGTQSCVECVLLPECVPPDALEMCNGIDDDCDPETEDGADEDWIDEPCDGADSDLCAEGERRCVDGEAVCTDATEDSPEICGNGIDDDCNGTTDALVAEKIGGDVRITEGLGERPDRVSLVWTGREYALAWPASREDGGSDIYFTRLTEEGEKVGDDVRITDGTQWSSRPSLVWTGSELGLAYEGDHTDRFRVPITFVRLSEEGTRIGEAVRIHVASDDADFASEPSLVWTGSELGLAWVRRGRDPHGPHVHFIRLSEEGVLLGDAVMVALDYERETWSPSLVWTGTEYGVAFLGGSGVDLWSDVYFARFSAEGIQMGGHVGVIERAPHQHTSAPSLVWTGTELGVAAADSVLYDCPAPCYREHIFLSRISAEGMEIGDEVRIDDASTPSRFSQPSLVWTGTEYGVTWYDRRHDNTEIYFAIVSEDGERIGDEMRITDDPGASYDPVMVWTGRELGIAWIDDRDGSPEIYFTRLGGCS